MIEQVAVVVGADPVAAIGDLQMRKAAGRSGQVQQAHTLFERLIERIAVGQPDAIAKRFYETLPGEGVVTRQAIDLRLKPADCRSVRDEPADSAVRILMSQVQQLSDAQPELAEDAGRKMVTDGDLLTGLERVVIKSVMV